MKKHITGFYIEVLLLIVVFIVMILVLTRIFGLGKMESVRANRLTNAVTLASDAAEAASGSENILDLEALLKENNNTVRENPETLSASYAADLSPAAGGVYKVTVHWLKQEASDLVNVWIDVFYKSDKEPVYSLETAVCTSAVGGLIQESEAVQ